MSATGTPAPVSNSFDYVPVRTLDGFVLDVRDCSARGMGLASSRSSRAVIVGLGGRPALCATRTAGFGDAEIRQVVHGCGQLYLDVSGRAAIADFARDVRQLVISDTCRACPDLPACAAFYVPAPRSFFEDDEAWLRAHLAGLEGRVLDVGLGQVPYLAPILDRIRAGVVEYHGVDPDPHAADAARAAGVPLTLHPGTIEDFRPEPGSFARVLALRSLNHFADVDRAVGSMAAALAPGGTLTLVESLPLPLVRGRRHARECHDQAAGGFQHYRNWDSHRVLELVHGRHPLRVAFHRPVGRDTCDQWILVFDRL